MAWRRLILTLLFAFLALVPLNPLAAAEASAAKDKNAPASAPANGDDAAASDSDSGGYGPQLDPVG